jgi:hypothetical protein
MTSHIEDWRLGRSRKIDLPKLGYFPGDQDVPWEILSSGTSLEIKK